MYFKTTSPFSCKEIIFSLLGLCLLIVSSCQKDNQSNLSQSSATCPPGTFVTDIDGNSYDVVSIGNQCWTKENLKTSRFNNGDVIAAGLDSNAWENTSLPAYKMYNDSAKYDSLFGKLYNYYTIVDNRGLCPTGWRPATINDWSELIQFLDPSSSPDTSCQQCKISSLLGLTNLSDVGNYAIVTNCPGNDSIKFKAMAGGGVSHNGIFGSMGSASCFWAAQGNLPDSSRAMLEFFCNSIFKANSLKNVGLSVRCVKE
ncbi:MAG: fibrobacter succinogenes major paralogous domain-containing protein [Bacteroidetes bacterium]|nr:fibrobacter succinogenes major paralogous domain-containing protein [Bacteroidota bacterium]